MVYTIKVGTKTYTDDQLIGSVEIQLGEDDRANSCSFTILDPSASEIEFWQKWAIGLGGIAVPDNLLNEPPKVDAATNNPSPGGSVTTGAGSDVNLDQLFAGSVWAGTKPKTGSNEGIFVAAGWSYGYIAFKKIFEGFYATPYDDGVGVMTIGFGAAASSGNPKTLAAIAKGRVTVEEANELLLDELNRGSPAKWIQSKLSFTANANQMGTLISLWFNGGDGCITALLNKGNSVSAISNNIPTHYINAGTSTEQGLRNRRAVEKKLFDLPITTPTQPISSTPTPTNTIKLGAQDASPNPAITTNLATTTPDAKPAISPGGTPIKILCDRIDLGVSGVEISDFYLVGFNYQPVGKIQFEGKGIRFKLTQTQAETLTKNANVKQIAQKLGEKHNLDIEVQADLSSDPIKNWTNYGESDYQLLLKAAQSQGLRVRVGVGDDKGKIILQAQNQTPTKPVQTQPQKQALPTEKPNTLATPALTSTNRSKSNFILTPDNLITFQFGDQASTDRITGQGLPPVTELPSAGGKIGKGFKVQCSTIDPKALTLKPGDILETKGLEAPSINRQWAIESVRPDFIKGMSELTLYLPTNIKEQATAIATTNTGVTNPASSTGVALPPGVPTSGKVLVFTDVPGQKNSAGTQKCVLRLIENGVATAEVEAISGNSGLKAVERSQDASGSGRPCPPGTYSLGPVEDAGAGKSWGEGLGRYVIEVLGTSPRQAIFIHSDFGAGGGTQGYSLGCVCPYSDTLMLKACEWVNGGAKTLIVGYSYLGGLVSPKTPTAQNAQAVAIQLNTGGFGPKILAQAQTWVNREFNPGATEQCMAFVRNILTEVGHPLRGFVTSKPADGLPTGVNLASSLSGSDCGTVILDANQLQPGDIITWQNTYGSWPSGTITHVGIAAGDGMCVDRSTSSQPVRQRAISSIGTFRLGVRLRVS